MLNIDFLENSGFFQLITLEKGEVLFDEGDIDNNLYIIKNGLLNVEKYTSNDRIETKLLAKISNNEIFGEGSLSGENKQKQVKIVASKYSELLKINSQLEFEKFLQKYTKVGIELLSRIIDITNKRLLEANYLITSSYKINKTISELNELNNKNLFYLVDDIKNIISCNYILYLEKHSVLENFLVLKYDTREQGKLKEIIIDLENKELNLEIINKYINNLLVNNNILELKNNNKNVGYLVIGYDENKNISEGEKKALSIIGVSFAGFVKQKQYYEENKNLEYLKT